MVRQLFAKQSPQGAKGSIPLVSAMASVHSVSRWLANPLQRGSTPLLASMIDDIVKGA